MSCKHLTFNANVAVTRIVDTDPAKFMADVRVNCAECGEHFRFLGLQYGCSLDQPMVSIDGLELRAAIAPGAQTLGFDI